MDFDRIAVFVRVVEEGSFTAAARALGIPKSSVSRVVASLEEELGVGLLRRTTRQLSLTDAGLRYVDGARRALAALDEARSEITREDQELEGHIRLTAPDDMPGPLLAEPLVEFSRRYPRITIETIITGESVDLVAQRIDLAVRAGRFTDSSLVVKRVGDDALELYAAPSYLARRGHPRRVADLAQHDCVLFRAGAGSRMRWTLTGPRGRASVDVRGALGADSMQFIADAIAAGAGIGLLPTVTALQLVQAHKIQRVLPPFTYSGGGIALVHAPVHRLPRRVAVLRDFLWEELRSRLTSCKQIVSSRKS